MKTAGPKKYMRKKKKMMAENDPRRINKPKKMKPLEIYKPKKMKPLKIYKPKKFTAR